MKSRHSPYYRKMSTFFAGRSGETRTRGLMVPNHARYQLRYASIWSGKRESNPQPSAWEATALPLSHSRIKPKNYITIFALCQTLFARFSNYSPHPTPSQAIARGASRDYLLSKSSTSIRICATSFSVKPLTFIFKPSSRPSK